MKKLTVLLIAALFVSFVSCPSMPSSAGGGRAGPLWTGDGGKGRSIAILAPNAVGLAENQNYLPIVVQGELVSNFSNYSAINVLDRVNLDTQYAELLSGYYDDNAQQSWDLGHLPPTDYLMSGSITRTGSGYALQLRVTRTADKMTEASYSGTFSFAELDSFTGIRRASLDLLQKLGVEPTGQARAALTRAAKANDINAQTALSRGIVAERTAKRTSSPVEQEKLVKEMVENYSMALKYDPSISEAQYRLASHADRVIQEILNSTRVAQKIQQYTAQNGGKRPAIIIGRFSNKTSVYIDTSVISEAVRNSIISSGKLDVISVGSDRAADIIITGSVDVIDTGRCIGTVEMTDIMTNARIWTGTLAFSLSSIRNR